MPSDSLRPSPDRRLALVDAMAGRAVAMLVDLVADLIEQAKNVGDEKPIRDEPAEIDRHR